MKKLYISPQIVFEPLEDEELMIAMSHTQTESRIIDPDATYTDTPGLIGESDAPIVITPGTDTGND